LQDNADKYTINIKQKQFIFEMLKNPSFTIEELSKMVGINPRTYYNWKNDPEFRKEVERFLDKISDRIADSYCSSIEKIAHWIGNTLDDDIPVSMKIKVSNIITEQLHSIMDKLDSKDRS